MNTMIILLIVLISYLAGYGTGWANSVQQTMLPIFLG